MFRLFTPIEISIQRKILIASIAVIVLAVLWLPFRFEYSIDCRGVILPEQEWIIRFTSNGGIQSILRNHAKGAVVQSTVDEIDRGDAVDIRFNDALLAKGTVRDGDTVCWLASSVLESALAERRGELAVAQMTVRSYSSGDKESIVKAAQEALHFAEKQVGAHRTKHERTNALYEKNLISREMYEESAATLSMLEIAAEKARLELRSVQTGLKPEDIELQKTRVAALEDAVNALQLQARLYTHISPIDGYAANVSGEDTLVRVLDSEHAIVQIAIPVEQRDYIHAGTRISIESLENGRKYRGKILRIEQDILYYAKKRVYLAYASIKTAGRVYPGKGAANCTVVAGKEPLREHLARFVSSFLGLS